MVHNDDGIPSPKPGEEILYNDYGHTLASRLRAIRTATWREKVALHMTSSACHALTAAIAVMRVSKVPDADIIVTRLESALHFAKMPLRGLENVSGLKSTFLEMEVKDAIGADQMSALQENS